MLQGTGPAPCPPEGALSKQVSYSRSRCGRGDYSDVRKTRGVYLAAKIFCQHHVQFHSRSFCISLCPSVFPLSVSLCHLHNDPPSHLFIRTVVAQLLCYTKLRTGTDVLQL